jgi:uncharacterized integral membrane protein
MNVLAWLVRIAFFCVVLWLAFRNLAPVKVSLTETVYWDGVPLIVVILASMLVGVFAGLLAMAPRVYRLRRQLAAAQARGGPRPAPSATGPATISGVVDVARNAGAVGGFDGGPRTRK